MSPDLPQYIEPARLADSAESLEGTLGIADMHRLRSSVDDAESVIAFHLSFSRHETGGIIIDGDYSTDLLLRCQRCLEPLTVHLEKTIRLVCIAEKAEEEILPTDLEPLLMEENRLVLLDLIEDEVLLGLPMSPAHEPEQCPATELLRELRETKESPFAVLRDLKTDNKH